MMTGLSARLFGCLCALALGVVASHAGTLEPHYDESTIDHMHDGNWGGRLTE
jgi:hypothetical protein